MKANSKENPICVASAERSGEQLRRYATETYALAAEIERYIDCGPPSSRSTANPWEVARPMTSRELLVLRQRPGWDVAVSNLRTLADGGGPGARTAARDYTQVYTGKRGAMVVDVVASRQRRYKTRVLPLVRNGSTTNPRHFNLWRSTQSTRRIRVAGLGTENHAGRRHEPG